MSLCRTLQTGKVKSRQNKRINIDTIHIDMIYRFALLYRLIRVSGIGVFCIMRETLIFNSDFLASKSVYKVEAGKEGIR